MHPESYLASTVVDKCVSRSNLFSENYATPMALCVKARGIKDIDNNFAYCPDCASGLLGPIYDRAFETVDSHFLSIGPSVAAICCRSCFKELTNYRSINECSPCRRTIQGRETRVIGLIISGDLHTIHVSGTRFL